MCSEFTKERLKRELLYTRKIIILNDVLATSSTRHILAIINRMSIELERMQPRTFSCNLSVIPELAPILIENIGRNLFKHNDVSWGKIISFLTISSAISSDCVKCGQHDIVQSIIDTTCSLLLDETGTWIDKEGGFDGLTDYIRPIGSEHITFLGWLTALTTFLLTVYFLWTVFKVLGRQVLNVL